MRRLLEDNYSDLLYYIWKLGKELNLPPGDLEEFVDSIRWIIFCFNTLAMLDKMDLVHTFAQEALQKLIPPSKEKIVAKESPQNK